MLARIRGALVKIGLAVFPRPSRQAIALVLAVSERQADTVIPTWTLLAKSHAELRLAERPGKSRLARAAEVSFLIFATRAAIPTWAVLARRTW